MVEKDECIIFSGEALGGQGGRKDTDNTN